MKLKQYMLLSLALLPLLLPAEKYAGEIFYTAPGVANQVMGNTGVTNAEALTCAWWNPALLALPGKQGAELMHAEQFNGLMQVNHFGAVWGTQNRMGLVITHIGISNIALTKLENDSLQISNNNRPTVWKRANNNDLMAYFGIGRSVCSNLQVGITPKLAYRDLVGKTGYGFGADLGSLWEITPALRFGAVLRDFFTTQVMWENGTREDVLPSLNAELGYQLLFPKWRLPVRLAGGVETLAENRKEAATFNFGSLSGDIHAGMAVSLLPQLKLMAGYDVNAITAGLGFSYKQMQLEYCYKAGSQDGLGYSQRVSAGWRW